MHAGKVVHAIHISGTRVERYGCVPAFQVRFHRIAQVGNHRLGVGGKGARAFLDVIAGERNAGLHDFRVDAGVQLPEFLLEQGAGFFCRVFGEYGVGLGFRCRLGGIFLRECCLCPIRDFGPRCFCNPFGDEVWFAFGGCPSSANASRQALSFRHCIPLPRQRRFIRLACAVFCVAFDLGQGIGYSNICCVRCRGLACRRFFLLRHRLRLAENIPLSSNRIFRVLPEHEVLRAGLLAICDFLGDALLACGIFCRLRFGVGFFLCGFLRLLGGLDLLRRLPGQRQPGFFCSAFLRALITWFSAANWIIFARFSGVSFANNFSIASFVLGFSGTAGLHFLFVGADRVNILIVAELRCITLDYQQFPIRIGKVFADDRINGRGLGLLFLIELRPQFVAHRLKLLDAGILCRFGAGHAGDVVAQILAVVGIRLLAHRLLQAIMVVDGAPAHRLADQFGKLVDAAVVGRIFHVDRETFAGQYRSQIIQAQAGARATLADFTLAEQARLRSFLRLLAGNVGNQILVDAAKLLDALQQVVRCRLCGLAFGTDTVLVAVLEHGDLLQLAVFDDLLGCGDVREALVECASFRALRLAFFLFRLRRLGSKWFSCGFGVFV